MEQQQDLLQQVEEEIYFERASAGMRFVNYLVDMILFYVLYFITFIIIGAVYAANRLSYNNERLSYDREPFILSMGFIYAVVFSLFLIYFTVIEGASKGRTLGKLITGTRAVMYDGSPLTWKAAFLRSLCRLIPFEPFSAFGIPWHDSITNTQVIKVRR